MKHIHFTVPFYSLCGSLSLMLLIPQSVAQTVTLIPTCGKPGDAVCISGSGWAEPNPLCRYIFTMDGVSIAADQQDGLYGPPATNGKVPSLANGSHTVLVQLVLDDASSTLIQQQTAPFTVVTTQPNPWSVTSPPGNSVNATFNPTNVCTVTPCQSLVFIQVMQGTGTLTNGTTQPVNWVTWNHPNGADLQANIVNNTTVDTVMGEKDPYYNGNDVGLDGGVQGVQGPSPVAATYNDTVNYPDSAFPAGFNQLTINFEVAVFCAQGDNAGEYVGTYTWQYSRKLGQAAAVTIGAQTSNQPSAALLAALNQWGKNASHPFTTPVPKPSPCIY